MDPTQLPCNISLIYHCINESCSNNKQETIHQVHLSSSTFHRFPFAHVHENHSVNNSYNSSNTHKSTQKQYLKVLDVLLNRTRCNFGKDKSNPVCIPTKHSNRKEHHNSNKCEPVKHAVIPRHIEKNSNALEELVRELEFQKHYSLYLTTSVGFSI